MIDFDMADVGGAADPAQVIRPEPEEPAADQVHELAGDSIEAEAFSQIFVGLWEVPRIVFGPEYGPLAVTPDKEPSALAAGRVIHGLLAKHAPWALPSRDMISADMMLALAFAHAQFSVVREIRANRAAIEHPKAGAPRPGEMPQSDMRTSFDGGGLGGA